MRKDWRTVRLLVIGALTFVSSARAQLGAELLFKPWEENRKIDGEANVLLFNSGSIGAAGSDFDLAETRSKGRFRFDPSMELSPSVGYKLTHLSIHDASGTVPGQLMDASIGAASPLWRVGEKGVIGGSLGAGYAGDDPFGNGRAWYGQAGVYFGKELEKDRSLFLSLDYNGNRSFFPDVPIPGIVYSFKMDPNLEIAAGVPYASATWHASEKLTLSLEYNVPDSLEAEIAYRFLKAWEVFANYQTSTDSFHFRGAPPDRRLFFQEQRVEAGFRWNAHEQVKLVVAGGYAFDRSFETGWDVRDSDTIADVSDEPYLRLGLEISF